MGVCTEILTKLHRAKNGNCFIIAAVKKLGLFGMLVPTKKGEKADPAKEDEMVAMYLDSMDPLVLESAFGGLVGLTRATAQAAADSAGKSEEAKKQLELKYMASLAVYMLPFMRVKANVRRLTDLRKKRRDQQGEQPQKIILTDELQQEETMVPLNELEAMKTSDQRSSTNTSVMLLMILVCAVLLLGACFLAKSLGNPGASEYPEHLKHAQRESKFRDLEAQLSSS